MSSLAPRVIVMGDFDDLRSPQIRFLEEASKLGNLTVLLGSDEAIHQRAGRPPKFPATERSYFLQALRYVDRVRVIPASVSHPILESEFCRLSNALQQAGARPDLWAVTDPQHAASTAAFCQALSLGYRVIGADQCRGFPETAPAPAATPPGRKKVVVTGCYDWFHSGHVRFCEEVSAYGDLYVIVGHDENIRLLKGEGHPLLPQAQRRYVVGAIRHVTQALVSTGMGWLDADPEIQRLKPDIYAVNEDGDKGGKREYCAQHGIQYLVLQRTPAPGLPRRTSPDLRGF